MRQGPVVVTGWPGRPGVLTDHHRRKIPLHMIKRPMPNVMRPPGTDVAGTSAAASIAIATATIAPRTTMSRLARFAEVAAGPVLRRRLRTCHASITAQPAMAHIKSNAGTVCPELVVWFAFADGGAEARMHTASPLAGRVASGQEAMRG